MLALGVDTSCYTTSAALCSDSASPRQARKLLPVPAGERGLRQSEAVFAHVRQLAQVVEEACQNRTEPISCVCASRAPRDDVASYMPVFQVGAAFGRSLASALGVPFYETSHQQGHIRAAQWGTGLKAERFLALHLSGGTTDVLLKEGAALHPLGAAMDLHAGQLVDRVGVALGLPFPCGPHLERLARQAMSEDCWGPGGPDLLVVAPPAIRPEVEHSPVAAAMGRGCAEKSRQLAEHYRRLAARLGARFLDGEGCELNRVDHMHLTQAGHAQLAARVGAVLSDPATGALGQ